VVTSGRAKVTSSGESIEVDAGSVFLVAAQVHRFRDLTADLSVLVFFGPAWGARRAASDGRRRKGLGSGRGAVVSSAACTAISG